MSGFAVGEVKLVFELFIHRGPMKRRVTVALGIENRQHSGCTYTFLVLMMAFFVVNLRVSSVEVSSLCYSIS